MPWAWPGFSVSQEAKLFVVSLPLMITSMETRKRAGRHLVEKPGQISMVL